MRRLISAAVLLLVLGCDANAPVAPRNPGPTLVASIVDGSSPGGLKGFYFRPPLISGSPVGGGEFDGSLLDLLTVEVCEWNGTACVGAPVSRITAESPAPEGLRIDGGGELYRALWKTADAGLDPAKRYRLRVLASGQALGYADVDVVDNASQGKVPGGGMVVVVNGSTLPIAFRVETGLGQRAGSTGGTVSLADGAVSLTLPPGALGGDVFLTAVPATNLPPTGPQAVPGTAWDFGPDGLVFAEPVTMMISYDPANIPPGVVEAELRIHKLVNGAFVQANAGVVDLVNHTVSAQVDGFSVYVLLQRLFPGSQEDLVPPVIQSIEVFDASSGTYGPATTLLLSGADVVLKTRITVTDNISGLGRLFVVYTSPTRGQRRFACYFFGPEAPATGSDTFGTWECTTTWPRYSEAGQWTLDNVFIEDKVQNFVFYFGTPNGFCAGTAPAAPCVANPAQVAVNSSPTDINEPVLLALDVSLNAQPRSYGPSVMVDAGASARPLVFRFQATDDLAGVGTAPLFSDEYIEWQLIGPSGQLLDFFFDAAGCPLLQGTVLNGTWECPITIPKLAEVGTWRINLLIVPDRVGNGGRAFRSVFRPNGAGQLCNARGNCVTPPTVEVTSLGDNEPPELQSVSVSVVGATVFLTSTVTDNLSGANFVLHQLSSTTSNQFETCFSTLSAGSSTNGTWTCMFTFSPFAARGEWSVQFDIRDLAGNRRLYRRRASDGFLCYTPQGGGAEVCQNLGDASIVVL